MSRVVKRLHLWAVALPSTEPPSDIDNYLPPLKDLLQLIKKDIELMN
ncbi:MAG: hypothetical protein ACUVQ5_01260 [Candidatus Methanomethylicaceae archaeon]